jgi:hypothetical protein
MGCGQGQEARRNGEGSQQHGADGLIIQGVDSKECRRSRRVSIAACLLRV